MNQPSKTLQIFTTAALYVALVAYALYLLHILDRGLYFLLDGPPFIFATATPMGWGALHLPSFIIGLALVALLPAAAALASLMVTMFERFMVWVDENTEKPEEEIQNG